MTTVLKPDICVIGAGSAGLTVAAAAAAFGTLVPGVVAARLDAQQATHPVDGEPLFVIVDEPKPHLSSFTK